MRTSKKLVVVGGGIGGLTAALALRRNGHEVVVLERRASAAEAGAGISLWPNAMRILRDLGLGPALEASAISDGRVTIRTRAVGRYLPPTCQSSRNASARRFASCTGITCSTYIAQRWARTHCGSAAPAPA